jgi:hypothetical protein
MDCVKNFFTQTIWGTVGSPRPKKPQYLPTYPPATPPGLPKELIHIIASYLPPHGEALLNLSCEELLHVLDPDSWDMLLNLLKERRVSIIC